MSQPLGNPDVRTSALDASIARLGGGAAPTLGGVGPATALPLRWTGSEWTRHADAPKPESVFGDPLPEVYPVAGWWLQSLTQLHPDSDGDMTLPLAGVVVDVDLLHVDPDDGEIHETVFAVACEVGRPQGRLEVRRVLMPWSDVAGAQPPNVVYIRQLLGSVDRIVARHRSGRADGHVAWLRGVQHLLVGLTER